MNSHIQETYLREVVTQCDFALNAVRGLNNVLPRVAPAAQAGNWQLQQTLHQEVFRSIHSFLTHASNVSRLLWPAPPRKQRKESDAEYEQRCADTPHVARGRILRQTTVLPDDHVLKDRKLRDHLEHFDERLDEWHAQSTRHNFVQDMIGPPNSISGIDDSDMMRWFDPSSNKMRFRGQEFDLQEITSGLETVRGACIAALEQLSPRRSAAASRSEKAVVKPPGTV